MNIDFMPLVCALILVAFIIGAALFVGCCVIANAIESHNPKEKDTDEQE